MATPYRPLVKNFEEHHIDLMECTIITAPEITVKKLFLTVLKRSGVPNALKVS